MANGLHPDINNPNVFVLYRYHPSLVAATIFAVLFGISTLSHVYQLIRLRSAFMIPLAIGGFFETIGYIGRILSSHDQWALGPYIMQALLLLLAPALFAASIYMVLGRVILLTEGEQYSLIRQRWLTKIFVIGDILAFLIQSAGGSILSGADKDLDKLKLGEDIIIAGLFAQIAFFGFFIVVASVFQIRGRHHLSKLDSSSVPWKKFLYVLYVSSMFILVRSVFRAIEYLQGNTGYLLKHEVFLYIFDAVLMFAVLAVMNVVHPGAISRLLKRKNDRGSLVELVVPDTRDRSKDSAPLTTGENFP
ncbi:RTA1-domain-containing protein [Lindgomyces ingoldianus]|uniref:RTA1-domain-containing protein n=1 Tax=Lindgomyces ingoldianus TaxID=673940 RepID=A0ACB6QYP6_9PLEO|nr:RTA1-domain-containing protein [Lindgomyces ingoldianus]KAF2471990.1 RTA1-domain-containing protein [Lindgomyces ingoldianus]